MDAANEYILKIEGNWSLCLAKAKKSSPPRCCSALAWAMVDVLGVAMVTGMAVSEYIVLYA